MTRRTIIKLTIVILTMNNLIHSFGRMEISPNILRFVSALLCTGAFIMSRNKKKHEIFYLFIAIYLILVNGNISLNVAFVLVYAATMNALGRRQLLKTINYAQYLMIAVVLFSLLTGLVDNGISMRGDGTARRTYGFVHPNYFGVLVFSITSIFILSREKVKWYHVAIALLASYALFKNTNSRTSFYSTLIMFFLAGILPLLPKKVSKMAACAIVTFLFLSPFVWKIPFMNSIQMNLLLSTRPYLFSRYIDSHTWVNLLFGGSKVEPVDNSFIIALYNCGLFVYAAGYAMIIKATIRSAENNRWMEVAFIQALLIISFAESVLVKPEIPCTIYFWMLVLMGIKKTNKQFPNALKFARNRNDKRQRSQRV